MSEKLVVGISDYKKAKGEGLLVTYALGSCVGICLYDQQMKIGGLSHIMLPDSAMFANMETNRMKFADTALPDLYAELKAMGASPARLTAKIAGGAQMFQTSATSRVGQIGERNVKMVKQVLAALRIPIIAEDTGANYGRTVFFDVTDGSVKIQALNKIIREM